MESKDQTINLMHILMFEVNLTGHHPTYLEAITQAHLKLGCIVTIAVSEKYKSASFLNRFSTQYKEFIHIVTLNEIECESALKSRFGIVGRELGLWRIFRKTFQDVSAKRPVDYVFLPYLDYCLNAIGLIGSPFGKVDWGGICMRPAFHLNTCGAVGPHSKLSYIKKKLFFGLLSSPTLKHVFTIDELLAKYVADVRQNLSGKIRFLADPAEPQQFYDSLKIRQQIGIPERALVILVYGALDERKGLDVLLKALDISPINVHLLLVGVQSKFVQNLLASTIDANLMVQKRLHEINCYVDDVTEQKVFSACDIVWVGYRVHYTMSGVLVRAGMATKPVISSDVGLLGWYARQHHLGIVVDLDRIDEVVTALGKLSIVEVRNNLGENGHRVFNNNTWPRFLDCILTSLRRT